MAASPKLYAIAGRPAGFPEEMPMLFSLSFSPFTINYIIKLFKVWGFWVFSFFFFYAVSTK